MAQIPIYNDFQVKLDPLRPVMQKTPDVSSGMQAFAKGLGQVAEVADRIDLRDAQSAAFKAQADIRTAWVEEDARLRNTFKGEGVDGYRAEADKWWNAQRERLSADLSPRARAIAGKDIANYKLAADTAGLGYIEKEKTRTREINFNTHVSALVNQTGPDAVLDNTIQKLTDSTVAYFAGEGLGADVAKEHARKYVGLAVANAVSQQLALNPHGAKALLDKHQGGMSVTDVMRLRETIDGAVVRYDGIKLGESIYKGAGPVGSDFEGIFQHTLKIEGGYVSNDAGKGETNLGINKSANPDLDIKNMTPAKAREVYRQRYWNAIGGDSLPPQVRAIAFDAAVNQGVSFANKIIAESQGDPAKMLALRREKYADLVRANPDKYGRYAKSWEGRLQSLEAGLSGQRNVSDLLARADQIEDPRIREVAARTIKENVERDAFDQKEQYFNDLRKAQDIAFRGPGGWRNVPDDVLARLTPDDRSKLMEGPPRADDPDTLLMLQSSPDKWRAGVIEQYRPLLTEATYRKYHEKGNGPGGEAKIHAATIDQQQFKDVLTRSGLYNLVANGASKRDKQELIALQGIFEREIDASQRKLNRQLTMDEKNTLLYQLVKPVKERMVIEGSLFGFRDGPTTVNRRAYQVQEPKDIVIPQREKEQILADMKAAGITPTEETVRQAYLRMK